MGNEEWEDGNGEWGGEIRSGEWGIEMWIFFFSGNYQYPRFIFETF